MVTVRELIGDLERHPMDMKVVFVEMGVVERYDVRIWESVNPIYGKRVIVLLLK